MIIDGFEKVLLFYDLRSISELKRVKILPNQLISTFSARNNKEQTSSKVVESRDKDGFNSVDEETSDGGASTFSSVSDDEDEKSM